MDVADLVAELEEVIEEVVRQQGDEPGSVVVTCPANWSSDRRRQVEAAMRRPVQVVSKVSAAAAYLAAEQMFAEGDLFAVYVLGGSTFTAAVVRVLPDGVEVLGTPEHSQHSGGAEMDAALLLHVDQQCGGAITALDRRLPEHAAAHARIVDRCRLAKEELSSEINVVLTVPLPDGDRVISVARGELDEMIEPLLTDTMNAVARTVSSAGLSVHELAGVAVVGGATLTPGVSNALSSVFERIVKPGVHPAFACALGAAAIAVDERAMIQGEVPAVVSSSESMATTPLTSSTVPAPGINKRRVALALVVAVAVFSAVGMIAVAVGRGPDGSTALAPEHPTLAGKTELNTVGPAPTTSSAAITPAPSPAGTPPAGKNTERTTQNRPSEPVVERRPSIDFFRGGDVAPVRGFVGSDVNWQGTSLNADGSISQQAIEVKPAAVVKPGDGRRVAWRNAGYAQYYFQTGQGRLDATSLVADGALVFDAVVNRPPDQDVTLAAHCQYPCGADLKATDLFRKAPVGQKVTMKVPLKCFQERGLDVSAVNTPFLLFSSGTFDVSVAGIRWEPGAASAPDALRCSSFR